MSEPPPLLRLERVVKDYGTQVVTRVLHGVDLELRRGELVALVGRSGSGKSTLLNIIGLLDRPTAGAILIDGTRLETLGDHERTWLRARFIGFIFQFHHLVMALSAVENVMMPLSARSGRVRAEHRARALAALADVGLADRADESPRRLSGGQQQRVAIARALVGDPPLVLADEPTGNLDTETAAMVMRLLVAQIRGRGAAGVLVTHSAAAAALADQVLLLSRGRLHRQGPDAR